MEKSNVEEGILMAENEGLEVSEATKLVDGDENKLENGSDVTEGGKMAIAVGEKRKRGRPRKQPMEFLAVAKFPKRGRGRPRGSGKWQMLAASMGVGTGDSSGSNFTPHIIEIQKGEDIVESILSFSKMTCDSICILSAMGAVSSAEIYQPALHRYEACMGQFSIVSLNGSHTYEQKRSGKMCRLSVQLAYPDGHLCGGTVAGSLIAAAPTQLTMGTFTQKPTTRLPSLASPSAMAATPAKVSNGEEKTPETAQRAGQTVTNCPNASAQPVD